ncbi:MAG: glycosyltransferase, partial [Bacteroidota bacterium]
FYLPNWIDQEKINPDRVKKHQFLESKKYKVLYSGNIGDKQDWNSFVQFCKDLNEDEYSIVIVGDGSRKKWLLEEMKGFPHVSYHPPVPFEDLSDLLCSADIHVLFQKPDVIDTVMPSKVLGMMASAKPSVIIGNPKSEVKTIFDESQGGLYFNHYSEEVTKALDDLQSDAVKSSQMGNNARTYIINNFSKGKILDSMLAKLKQLKDT